MRVWIILIVGSAFIGFLTAVFIKKNWAVYAAGAIPWFLLLTAITYTEYLVPYQGDGSHAWPVVQLIGGTIAAVIGVVIFMITRKYLDQNKS